LPKRLFDGRKMLAAFSASASEIKNEVRRLNVRVERAWRGLVGARQEISGDLLARRQGRMAGASHQWRRREERKRDASRS
jgi:hypothetical protein